MDALAGFAEYLCQGERMLTMDIKSGYHHFRLRPQMPDWNIFRNGNNFLSLYRATVPMGTECMVVLLALEAICADSAEKGASGALLGGGFRYRTGDRDASSIRRGLSAALLQNKHRGGSPDGTDSTEATPGEKDLGRWQYDGCHKQG